MVSSNAGIVSHTVISLRANRVKSEEVGRICQPGLHSSEDNMAGAAAAA